MGLRVDCCCSVELRLLDDNCRSIHGYAIHMVGHELRVVVNEAVEVSRPASVRLDDWLVFGEVSYCVREYSHYAVGLELDQAVLGLHDIEALRRNRLNERSPNIE